MKYQKVIKGRFVSRPNRFIAKVEIDGVEETVHVKNTGRCRELLIPGCTVFLSVSDNPARKTRCDLVAVLKERTGQSPLLINMDSQIPNDATYEWLKKGILFSPGAEVRREVTYGNSRFDFYIEDGNRRIFMEVKGVTLENNGEVLFPDAPTERGVKHLNELISCIKDGYQAYLLFVIQMQGVHIFRPNDKMHEEFGNALRRAHKAGVQILAMDCEVTADSISLHEAVEVAL
ncbi:MAG: DNA/RNA nuclease SfsA [Lachnospiraceae bacterium]